MAVSRHPRRLRRERTKGWRKPEGSIYVGRGSKWGNPHRVGADTSATEAVALYERASASVNSPVPGVDEIQAELAGADLLCWCSLDRPCHADYLLAVANRPPEDLSTWSDTESAGGTPDPDQSL